MPPDPTGMVVPSALPLKLICDVAGCDETLPPPRKFSMYATGSGDVQKSVEKFTNTLEKFIRHIKCRPGPKDCKNIYKRIVRIFGKYRNKFVDFLEMFLSFFTCKIYLRFQRQKNSKVAVHFHICVLQHPTTFETKGE